MINLKLDETHLKINYLLSLILPSILRLILMKRWKLLLLKILREQKKYS